MGYVCISSIGGVEIFSASSSECGVCNNTLSDHYWNLVVYLGCDFVC